MARILVVGAGVGGLTAAALLAKAGHNVTVLEAHVYAGGCAGTFYHQRYRFDAGATLAGGFHPGGPHDVVGKQLGIDWKIQPAEPAWQVHLPDRVVTRWGNAQRWHDELSRVFADAPDIKRITVFNRAVEGISDAVWDFAARRPAFPPANVNDLMRTALALRPATLRTLPHILDTMGEWSLRSKILSQPYLTFLNAQLLISAQTTADRASALFGAAAYDLPRYGVNHVEGGIGTLAAQLAAKVREYGGRVLFRQEVTHFETSNGRIVAATTNKQQQFDCDVCIANLTPWDMARLLGDAAPKTLIRETQSRPDEWGAFTLYAGVEGVDDLASEHHQVIADYAHPLGETNSIFMSFSMPGDTARAPAGFRTLTISTHTRAQDWWELRNTPGMQQAYEDRVALYSERMLSHAERAVPGIRNRIRLLLPGTPVTFRYFTRRHKGGVGGFPFTSLLHARGPWTGMRNAWLVGDSIFPGQSTAGVTMGALRVADDVARHLSRA